MILQSSYNHLITFLEWQRISNKILQLIKTIGTHSQQETILSISYEIFSKTLPNNFQAKTTSLVRIRASTKP